MDSQKVQPHFVLFPLMAQGHLIPMVDIAKLLAQRGVVITIVTTPANAARCKSTVVRAVESGLKIQIVEFQFVTSEESGFPPGCETLDMLPVSLMHLWHNFLIELNKSEEQVERLFETLQPKPSCIISDFCFSCTAKIANKFNVPRISFHGTGCFALLCNLMMLRNKSYLESITSESDLFVMPGFPGEIKFRKSQLYFPGNTCEDKEVWNQVMEADFESFGVVINSFEEIEPTFVREYSKARRSKVWCIGPVSLCNQDNLDKARRGNKASIDQPYQCITWLDSQQPSSVIYVCLGSLCNLSCSQLIELGLALEASMRPFIWAIRGSEVLTEFENWIEANGLEDRIKGRGMLIRGWAPQVLVLSHNAVGGFITHCGWNSTIEGITAGVPLMTWPMFGEQFTNEKLAVEVLRIGVRVGAEYTTLQVQEEKKHGVFIRKEELEKVIEMLMDHEGEEGKSRGERARELAKVAKHAVEKGGSSSLNIEMLIQDVVKQAQNMREKRN